MTPFALRVARAELTANPRSRFARLLAGASCFDVTPVEELICQTAKEAWSTMSMVGEDPQVEHGGLLFGPAEHTWIESRGPFALGALIHAVEDQLCFTVLNRAFEELHGFIELQPDGEHFVVRHDVRDTNANGIEASAHLGMFLAAALLLINAPRGVVRSTEQPHKGFVRQARNAFGRGFEVRPYHTIRLSTERGEIGVGAGHAGTPKAFHFCRSHVRRLPSGVQTRVRAHWRGDPSLGVCRSNYAVAA